MSAVVERGSTPLAAVRSLWGNRQLIFELARRDVIGRYRGSFVGLAWSFFNPLLLLFAYTFVFGIVFKARWAGGSIGDTSTEFALVLFVGLIIHSLMADCVIRAPGLVLSNPNFVKKVVFPLEILAAVTVCSALFHSLVSFAVLVLAILVVVGSLPASAIVVPLILLPYALGVLGTTWALASLGVFLRDIGQTVGILVMLMLFLSPIFFPLSAVPPQFVPLVKLNPLTYFVETTREALFFGQWPAPGSLLLHGAGAVVVGCLGFWWFQKTRNGFADVI